MGAPQVNLHFSPVSYFLSFPNINNLFHSPSKFAKKKKKKEKKKLLVVNHHTKKHTWWLPELLR